MSRYQPKAMFDDQHFAVLDIETISGQEPEDGGFPPWATHTSVVASVLTCDRDCYDEWQFEMTSIRFCEDVEPLERLESLLRGRSCVTANGRAFDLPVLMLAAQSIRTFNLPALTAAAAEPRYVSAKHYDILDKYSNYGSARGCSLAMLCDAVGVASKVSAHGDEVGKLYDEGKIETIVEYCEGDVVSTTLLFAHCRAMEKGDASYHASLISQLVRWIQIHDHEHLLPFAEIDDLGGLLRLSLIGQIDAATRQGELSAAFQAKRALDASFTRITHY